VSLNKMKVAVAAGLLSTVVAGVSMTVGANAATKKVNWATVTSAKAGGGMAALVKAAQKEGHVNVITIPLAGWANYGAIMKDFTKKYGIHRDPAGQGPCGRAGRGGRRHHVRDEQPRAVGTVQGGELESDSLERQGREGSLVR